MAFALASVIACSEAAGLSPDAGEHASDSDAGGDGAGGNGDGGATAKDSSVTFSDAAPSGVVLNEICGKGDNWVELMNTASSAVDVTGYAVSDSEKDGGGPKISEATTFPSGTILSPNSYLVVAGALSDGGMSCPDGGQSYCFNATWGISNKEGETIYLLDKTSAVAERANYPAATLTDGQTWGRLPNGSGAFATAAATPGAPNHAP